jgi:hypothetical protein
MIVVRDHTVEIANLRPALWHALNVYDQLRQEHGVSGNTVITSGNDGRHSLTSLHNDNSAVDARSRDVPRGVMETIVEQMRKALGIDFDVLWEKRDQPNEHLHIEVQPRRRPVPRAPGHLTA